MKRNHFTIYHVLLLGSVVLAVLKLTEVIHCSWWIVTAPLWMAVILTIALAAVIAITYLTAYHARRRKRIRRVRKLQKTIKTMD